MKIHASILLLLLISTLLLPGCKKFEEDDEWIHLRTVKQRIEGQKEIIEHTIGITDVLAHWKKHFGDFYVYFSLEDYNSNKSGEGYKLKVFQKESDILLCSGQWGFWGGSAIVFYFDCLDAYSSQSWPDRIHGASGYIIKLSNRELWLKSEEIYNDIQQSNSTQIIKFVQYKPK